MEEWFETEHASNQKQPWTFGISGVEEFFDVDQEVVAEAHSILEMIRSMPTDQDLTALAGLLNLDEEREPSQEEIALMNDCLR